MNAAGAAVKDAGRAAALGTSALWPRGETLEGKSTQGSAPYLQTPKGAPAAGLGR